MASTAHCFYCFESLSASFEHRETMGLARVEQLWERYQIFKQGGAPDKATSPSAEQHADSSDVMDDEEEPVADDDEDVGEESEDNEPETRNGNQAPAKLQLPSISRLQGHSPSASTPSTPSLSANSSQSALTNPSSVSSASSQTSSKSSFFSLPGRRNSKRSEPAPTAPPARTETETYPLFVTWNTVSRHGHKSLRGCIGTFEAQDLPSGLKTYALTSAFDDTRFTPISPSELPHLSCSLTLLTSFTPCAHALDWTLGLHGLRISFTHNGKRHGATYLPDVATDQGWTKEETVESLMRKAGWDGAGSGGSRGLFGRRGGGSGVNGGRDDDKREPWNKVGDMRAVRYRGLKASASAEEWREWRSWVDATEGGKSKGGRAN